MHKRAQERYTPRTVIQATNAMNEETLGTLANISLGGFLLTSQHNNVPDGAVFQMILEEQSDGGERLNINLGATCLWHSDATSPGYYWCGFQIIDISPEDEKKLKSYIDSLSS